MQTTSIMPSFQLVLKFAALFWLCCLTVVPVLASQNALAHTETALIDDSSNTEQQRVQEKNRLREQGDAVRALAQKQEAQCYQRFAVEDCLQDVRRQQRKSEAQLRQRETALNDQERQERAAARRQTIAQKLSQAPEPAVQMPSQEIASKPETRLQDQEAAQRAVRQQQKQQAAQAQKAQRIAAQASRASAARERQANKLRAAQERQKRAQNSQVATSVVVPDKAVTPLATSPQP